MIDEVLAAMPQAAQTAAFRAKSLDRPTSLTAWDRLPRHTNVVWRRGAGSQLHPPSPRRAAHGPITKEELALLIAHRIIPTGLSKSRFQLLKNAVAHS